MLTINIFLASSLNELRDDRMALGDYVRKLNDIYTERGVYFRLFLCEDEDLAIVQGRKQDEYNQQIMNSRLVIVLFRETVGKHTMEEFEIAYQHFMDCGTPAILTCFRVGENVTPSQSVIDFMNRLDHEIGHYYKTYMHIDSLKLAVIMQIKLMNLDVPVEFRNGAVLVAGQSILTLENLPIVANNRNLQKLREEYKALEVQYLGEKARWDGCQEHMSDVFRALTQRRMDTKQALEQLEQDIFDMLVHIETENCKGSLTPRQRKAADLLEKGDSEAAMLILDMDEIRADCSRAEEMAERMKETLELHIDEMLMRIDVLKTYRGDFSRFDEITRIYEEAVALEERQYLSMRAAFDYCYWLRKQNDFSRAIPLARRCLKLRELDGDMEKLAETHNLLGVLLYDSKHYPEAEKEYIWAKEAYERLAIEKPATFGGTLALVFNNLGNLYDDQNQFTPAEQEFLRAKEVYSSLEVKSVFHQYGLALVCSNLGFLYYRTNQYEKAEQELLQAKDILEPITVDNQIRVKDDLAIIYNRLGLLYEDANRLMEAERAYRKALSLCEHLAAENPAAYEPDLTFTCSNLGSLYRIMKRYEESGRMYLRSKEILLRLTAENPEVFEDDLALTCNGLGTLYSQQMRLVKAVREYRQAREILERLATDNPAAFEKDLAVICNNLGDTYCSMGRYAEARELLQRAKEIRGRLASEHPDAFEPKLAITCNNLGNLYLKMGFAMQVENKIIQSKSIFVQAEKEFLQARDLLDRYVASNPSAFELNLALICQNLGILNIMAQKYVNAESFLSRACEIQERLSRVNSEAFLPDLKNTYLLLVQVYQSTGQHSKAKSIKRLLTKLNQ